MPGFARVLAANWPKGGAKLKTPASLAASGAGRLWRHRRKPVLSVLGLYWRARGPAQLVCRTSCGADIGEGRAEQSTRALGRTSVRGSVRCDLHRLYLGGRPFRRRRPLRHRCHRRGDGYRSLRAWHAHGSGRRGRGAHCDRLKQSLEGSLHRRMVLVSANGSASEWNCSPASADSSPCANCKASLFLRHRTCATKTA